MAPLRRTFAIRSVSAPAAFAENLAAAVLTRNVAASRAGRTCKLRSRQLHSAVHHDGTAVPAVVDVADVDLVNRDVVDHRDAAPIDGPVVPGSPRGTEVRRRRTPGGEMRPPRMPPGMNEAEAEAPGHRRTVPDAADPGAVAPSGAVHHDVVARDIRTHIARRIADVDHIRRRVIDAYIRHVVQRRTARNRVHHGRHAGCRAPWTERRRGDEPHAVVERIERALADPDHRDRRIDGLLQRRAVDRLKRRIAVVGHAQAGGAAGYGRNLRNGILDRRFACLRRAGHRCADAFGGVCRRDAREVSRQAGRRNVLPRIRAQISRPEPAAGDEHVVRLSRGVQENPVGRIGHVQQACVLDRRVLRRTFGLQQFGGGGADVDRRRSGHRALRLVRPQQVDLVVLHRDFLGRLQLCGRIGYTGPRTFEFLRLHPVIGDV